AARVQLVPIGEDGIVEVGDGQAAIEYVVGGAAGELEVTRRADVGGVEGLAVEVVGEGQGDGGDAVLAVVADIVGGRYEAAQGLVEQIVGVRPAGGGGHACVGDCGRARGRSRDAAILLHERNQKPRRQVGVPAAAGDVHTAGIP